MVDGFFALVDDRGWSTAPRIPGRLRPRPPTVGGVLNIGFEADEPVSFAAPVEQRPRRLVPVRLPRRHWWSRSRIVMREPLPLVPLVRVGFFDLRGRLRWSSAWLPYGPTDTITVSEVSMTTAPVET